MTDLIAAFEAAWNASDDAERLRLLAIACVPDAVFVSPQGTTAGIGALNASIAEFRRAFPAAVVSFGRPDEHGGYARVAWPHGGIPAGPIWSAKISPSWRTICASGCSSHSTAPLR